MHYCYRNTIAFICCLLLHANAFSQHIFFVNQTDRDVLITKRTLLEESSYPYTLEKNRTKVQSVPIMMRDAVYNVMMADPKGAWGTADGCYYVLQPNDTLLITNVAGKLHLTHPTSPKRSKELAMGEDIVSKAPVKPLFKLESFKYLVLHNKRTPLARKDKVIDSLSLPVLRFIEEYGIKNHIDPSVTQLYKYNILGLRYYNKLTVLNEKDVIYIQGIRKFYRDSLAKWSAELNCDACMNVPSYNIAARKIYNLRFGDLSPADHLNTIAKNSQGRTRNFLLSTYMNEQLDSGSDSVTELMNRYNQLCTDNLLKSIVKENYQLATAGKAVKQGTIMLMTHDKKTLSFEELVKSNKGKIVYLDFWASWCHPCLEEFPYSAKLRKNLQGKAVRMIYISVDRDFGSWAKAGQMQQLPAADSYILINAGKDALSKMLELNTVPKYAILSKEGKFINTNASRPSEPNSYRLLQELSSK